MRWDWTPETRAKLAAFLEVRGLTRLEQASAFLAVLELRRSGELQLEQAAPFAPIRISRSEDNSLTDERTAAWTARSA